MNKTFQNKKKLTAEDVKKLIQTMFDIVKTSEVKDESISIDRNIVTFSQTAGVECETKGTVTVNTDTIILQCTVLPVDKYSEGLEKMVLLYFSNNIQ